MSRSPPSSDTNPGSASRPPRAGEPFSSSILTKSPRLFFLSFRQRARRSYLHWSSWFTTGGGSSISTSQSIQRLNGQRSSLPRRFPSIPPRATCYEIAMAAMAGKFSEEFGLSARKKPSLRRRCTGSSARTFRQANASRRDSHCSRTPSLLPTRGCMNSRDP